MPREVEEKYQKESMCTFIQHFLHFIVLVYAFGISAVDPNGKQLVPLLYVIRRFCSDILTHTLSISNSTQLMLNLWYMNYCLLTSQRCVYFVMAKSKEEKFSVKKKKKTQGGKVTLITFNSHNDVL